MIDCCHPNQSAIARLSPTGWAMRLELRADHRPPPDWYNWPVPHQPSDDEIDRIAGRFGLSRSGLVLLGGGYDWSDGTVWLDRSGGRILKVKQLPVGDAVGAAVTRDRLRLVGALVIGGAPLIRPLPAADGDLVVEVDTGESRFVAYTYRFVPGRPMRAHDPSVVSGGYHRAVGLVGGHA